jgi:CRISPR-associated endonuclease/helicase Cas3
MLTEYRPQDLLEDYPLKPHELLRDNSSRVFDRLKRLKAEAGTPVWLMADDDSVSVTTLEKLIGAGKEEIERMTVLLPPSAGGLDANGMMDATSTTANDVADEWYADATRTQHRRIRVWRTDDKFAEKIDGMRWICTIAFAPPEDDEDAEGKSWYWYERPQGGDSEGSRANKKPVLWCVHTDDVIRNTSAIVGRLLTPELQSLFILAAKCHDLGKRRKLFQTVLGNSKYPEIELAKSGKKGGRIEERYRHEFGSLLDIQAEPEFMALTDDDLKAFVLHVIAAHHGRGRPHFPANEAFDPEPNGRDAEKVACGVPQRFARLQRKYGRWGLAYLESLLRAADYAASAKPSKFVEETP